MALRTGSGRRSEGVLALLLIPCALTLLSHLGETQALYADQVGSVTSLAADTAIPPVVSPGVIDLVLYVGDRAERCDIATVSNPSGWSIQVSIAASGWLTDSDVEIGLEPLPVDRADWPSGRTLTLLPYQQARVYFTKAAVQKPTQITGEVRVTFTPGAQIITVPVSGEVINPANAARPRTVPAECVKSTPRTLTPDGTEPEEEEQAQDPIVEPPTVESTTGESLTVESEAPGLATPKTEEPELLEDKLGDTPEKTTGQEGE